MSFKRNYKYLEFKSNGIIQFNDSGIDAKRALKFLQFQRYKVNHGDYDWTLYWFAGSSTSANFIHLF